MNYQGNYDSLSGQAYGNPDCQDNQFPDQIGGQYGGQFGGDCCQGQNQGFGQDIGQGYGAQGCEGQDCDQLNFQGSGIPGDGLGYGGAFNQNYWSSRFILIKNIIQSLL